jgi:hypothetical protein
MYKVKKVGSMLLAVMVSRQPGTRSKQREQWGYHVSTQLQRGTEQGPETDFKAASKPPT